MIKQISTEYYGNAGVIVIALTDEGEVLMRSCWGGEWGEWQNITPKFPNDPTRGIDKV